MAYDRDDSAVPNLPDLQEWTYEQVLDEIREKTTVIASVEQGLGPWERGSRERLLHLLRCHRMLVVEQALRLVPMSRLSMDVGETIAGISAMRDADCEEKSS